MNEWKLKCTLKSHELDFFEHSNFPDLFNGSPFHRTGSYTPLLPKFSRWRIKIHHKSRLVDLLRIKCQGLQRGEQAMPGKGKKPWLLPLLSRVSATSIPHHPLGTQSQKKWKL